MMKHVEEPCSWGDLRHSEIGLGQSTAASSGGVDPLVAPQIARYIF